LRSAGVETHAVESVYEIPEPVTAAIVAVPPPEVAEAVNSLLSAQFSPPAILLEKPLGPDHQTGTAIVERGNRESQLAYMETFLHSSAYDVMLDEIATGRLAGVNSIHMAVRGSLPRDLGNQWRGDRRSGGEVLHDWGVHSLGFALHLANNAAKQLAQPTVAVANAEWMSVGTRDLLKSCGMTLDGYDADIYIDASWEGSAASPEEPDILVKCDRGDLALYVRKTDGSSDWVCVDYNDGNIRELASRRYPKELFIRGVAGFLRRTAAPSNRQDKYDIALGLEALNLADTAYSQACSI
jgi:predicted dehydrogenase